jgi:hypothetical protein
MTATAIVDVALRDGSTVRVRPVTAEDEPQLRALLARLSEESRWLRFFSAGQDLDNLATRASAHLATPPGATASPPSWPGSARPTIE